MAGKLQWDPDDPPATICAEYFSALALPEHHGDAWDRMTFDLRAHMARLMLEDIDRVDPAAVSTVLDGPTPGNFIWDAFAMWHAGHIHSRWGMLFLLGARLWSEPGDRNDVRLVHLDAVPDDGMRHTFMVSDVDGWKVDALPEAPPDA